VDWTALGLIGFAALTAAELLVFRVVLPPRRGGEAVIWLVLDILAWILVAVLLLAGLAMLIANIA
jgi:uncharacterized membrane protein